MRLPWNARAHCKWRVKGEDASKPNLQNITFEPCYDNCSDYGWETYPEGLREMVKWAYERYQRPIYITKNGIADSKDKQKNKLSNRTFETNIISN
jgi:beta-glucosidase/6-phospho-beta-glucosidase/beta-galactosidase